MQAGFRPGTQLRVGGAIKPKYGLDPNEPGDRTIEPGDLKPEVVHEIMHNWGQVKKPAIVTFVVDTSASMWDLPAQ